VIANKKLVQNFRGYFFEAHCRATNLNLVQPVLTKYVHAQQNKHNQHV